MSCATGAALSGPGWPGALGTFVAEMDFGAAPAVQAALLDALVTEA